MKKFFKKILLFGLVFLITMYFIGSCTERPESKPKEENNTPVYTELTPDEYQKQMDELLKKQPVTHTAFKSPILQAHASELTDVISDFIENTALTFADNWITGWKDITGRSIEDNPAYPSNDFEKPVESIKIPYQYEFYGKNRVVYKNGTFEVIECRLMTSEPVGSTKKKTGHIMYRRTNQFNSTTSFSFDISVTGITKNFNSNSAFTVSYIGLESNISGLYSSFISDSSTGLKTVHVARFAGSSVNKLHQFNINSDVAVTIPYICYYAYGSSYPNVFSMASTVTNDYEFSQSVNNYYINNKFWRFPNVYYNNNAGDIINQNNVSNYNQYGYTYNNVTNSIEFDPDVFAGFLDADVIPKFKLAFDDIFSHFPDIGAEFGDLDIKYTNIIDIMNEINTPTVTTVTGGTYPVVTGDINVNVSVIVTFPEEKKYPAFTTESAFVAKNPDVDFALDSPLPVRALKTAGGFITLASYFIEDSGLMPIVLMSVSLGLVVMFIL